MSEAVDVVRNANLATKGHSKSRSDAEKTLRGRCDAGVSSGTTSEFGLSPDDDWDEALSRSTLAELHRMMYRIESCIVEFRGDVLEIARGSCRASPSPCPPCRNESVLQRQLKPPLFAGHEDHEERRRIPSKGSSVAWAPEVAGGDFHAGGNSVVGETNSFQDGAAPSGPAKMRGFRSLRLSVDRGSMTSNDEVWPKSIELQPILKDVVVGNSFHSKVPLSRQSQPNKSLSAYRLTRAMATRLDVKRETIYDAIFILQALDPHSRLGILLDGSCLLAAIHSLIIVPYVSAWEQPIDDGLFATYIMAISLWTLDLILGFIIGYYDHGELERRISLTARNYVKSWFLPYAAAWLCDLIRLSKGQSFHSEGWEYLIEIIPLVRFEKLVRLFDRVATSGVSDSWRQACLISYIFAGFIWGNHILTCMWFAVGSSSYTDTGGTWWDSVRWQIQGYEMGVPYQYCTTFQFSIALLASGGAEGITPLNSVERILTTACLIFGVLIGSVITSSFSAALHEMRMAKVDQIARMREVRLYLLQNRVSPLTAARVQRQIAERMRNHSRLMEKDVSALSVLSASLYLDLRQEILGMHLQTHPFLHICACIDQHLGKQLCGKDASSLAFVVKGDSVFYADEEAAGPFLVLSGDIIYRSKFPCTAVEGLQKRVCAGRWICEAALWTCWIHVGSAEARHICELFCLRTQGVLSVFCRSALIKVLMVDYATKFHKALIHACPPNSEYPDDIDVPGAEYSLLIREMTHESQMLIGKFALVEMSVADGHGLHREGAVPKLELLEKELQTGKSCLHLTASGQLERQVCVSVVRVVSQHDGFLLVHLGKCVGSSLEPVCMLPGEKQEEGETAEGAARRVVGMMRALVGEVERFDSFSTERTWKESASTGLRTLYIRTTYTARLTDLSFSDPAYPVSIEPTQRVGEGEEYSLANMYRVYVLGRSERGFNIFAWLPEFVLDSLNSEKGKVLAKSWLSLLDFSAYNTTNRVSLPGEVNV